MPYERQVCRRKRNKDILMITREKALELLARHGVCGHLLQHSLASEAVLGALARHFGEDVEVWSRAGLLHDLDYPATESTPERHGLEAAAILADELPEEALHAICAHNAELNGSAVETRFDVALRCGETVTGLVTAAALVRPTGIAGMEVKSLKKKLKDKAFAAGVNRDIVKSCPDMGLTLEEFLALAIEAMSQEAEALGLLKG